MAGIYIYSDKAALVPELIGLAKAGGRTAHVISLPEGAVLPENYAKAMAELLKAQAAEAFFVGATARGREIAARVAGYLDCEMASDVSALTVGEKGISVERVIYGGAVIEKAEFAGFGVFTIPTGVGEAAPVEEAQTVTLAGEADGRVALVSAEPIPRQGTDLKKAEKIVCVGMGVAKHEDLAMAEALAEVLGAEMGCSRNVAEERHWFPTEQYIGMTGVCVAPKLYLSMGVSGQIQHTYGIRDAQVVIAVDSNEAAPIFKAADYGIVGDMYEVIPALTEALKQ